MNDDIEQVKIKALKKEIERLDKLLGKLNFKISKISISKKGFEDALKMIGV